MTASFSPLPRLVLALACLVPVVGAFFVSAGLFTIDEFIYLVSADAMANHASLTVDNGFERFASGDLRLWLLVDGPNGLAPQYPPGLAILGMPFYSVFGARGLILMNAVAAAGVAFLTWRIALKLYADAAVALVAVLLLVLGTFQLDYAWGIWPHMTSAFFVLLAFYLALKAMEAEAPRAVFGLAAGAGLAVGLGMTLRADIILALPVFTVCALLYATRPVLMLLGGALGFAPGVAALAAMNQHKFGTLNFLSYGRTGSGGGDDVTTYLGVAAIFLIALVALFAVRGITWSSRWVGPGLTAGAGAVAVIMLIPATGDFLRALLRGYTALFVDARTITDTRHGVGFASDGSLLFWGVAKKAMFQSLPWLGVLAALLFSGWKQAHRRAHVILMIFVLVWSLPFAFLAWHGGFSSSMRYFLPLLPPLAMLGAALVVELASRSRMPVSLLVGGAGFGLAFSLATILSGEVSAGFTQQALTLVVFIAVAASVAVASVRTRLAAIVNPVALATLGFGIGVSFFGNVIVDVSFSQIIREKSATMANAVDTVPGPVLFYGAPETFAFAASRPDALVGVSDRLTSEIDPRLFEDALGEGYRVFADRASAMRVADLTDLAFVDTRLFPDGSIVEVVAVRDLAADR